MKLYKFLTAFLLVLFLSACGNEFIDIAPQDRVTGDNFYRNEAEIRAATASLYGMPWFDFNSTFFWLAGDAMSGNIYYTYDQEGQFFYLTFNEGNSYLSRGWSSLFRVVSYSNSIIDDMPRIAGAAGVSDAIINKALGEARFIRASAYYMLVEFWGEVPIVENSASLIGNNNLNLPKNTRASVYEFIRRDLVFAAENLPTSDIPGRVTAWSAKGMLAKLHLTIAQSTQSAEDFTKAREYAADVIENSGLYLMDDYEDLFKIENNNNPESLFALQWVEGAYGVGNSRQANFARNSLITANSECWGAGKSLTYDFVQSIEANDARRSSIYMTLNDHYPEIRKADGGYTYNLVTLDDQGREIEASAPVLNNIKKYVVGSAADNNGKVTTGQAAAINQDILRLADVYLIYAEAALGTQSSTNDANALAYFNEIRERANLPTKSNLTFEDILKERRVEFAIESQFWFDIKRYYYRSGAAAIAYLNNQQRGHTYFRDVAPGAADANTMEGYILQAPETPIAVFESDMFLPIPAGEVLFNSKLAPDAEAVEYVFD